ncbi:peptidyl-prolyl cis-trans isomerase [Paenibacillus motobuensis]|uniref:peptidyl-prolyl cis-trans isomerase n=1 Tax=Paenibacillus TaxID=44249 RepID=UPI00203E44AD|nr:MULTISPECIES: peptidyl-prolyl cis-trans isomerase [Paenibacillus]MCM3041876.1 peptidyl-prolyl cis-trans isomerase [Paenibacillus lutimineralis]MCM3648980.1 peptidyl-prolyl cis-trans isomerase [Paenibacillus motobuensis]
MEDKEKDLELTGKQEDTASEPENGHKDPAGQAVPDSEEANFTTESNALAETTENNQTDIEEQPQAENEGEAAEENEVKEELASDSDEAKPAEHYSWTPSQEPASGGNSGSKVWPIVSLVLAVLLIIVLIKPPFASNKAEAIATVNGVEISKDILFDELASSGGGEAALDNLINRELVNQEAKKANIQITTADIDKEIETYKESFGSEDAFNQALASSGMTLDEFKDRLDMQLKLTKLLEPKINVTDEQVKETFDQYKESFNTPEEVRLSVILVGTEDEAKGIIKELNGGADFTELAKSKSLDTVTKDNGGDTGFFGKGESGEEAVEEAAFKLAKDEISEPIKTANGYQVIKLTDRKEAHTATLEEKKDEIRKGLVSQQVSQMSSSWLEEVRGKAKITNKLTDSTDTADTDNTAAK